jgi:hypothetical protein
MWGVDMVRVVQKQTSAGARWFVYAGTTRIGVSYKTPQEANEIARIARQNRMG